MKNSFFKKHPVMTFMVSIAVPNCKVGNGRKTPWEKEVGMGRGGGISGGEVRKSCSSACRSHGDNTHS